MIESAQKYGIHYARIVSVHRDVSCENVLDYLNKKIIGIGGTIDSKDRSNQY